MNPDWKKVKTLEEMDRYLVHHRDLLTQAKLREAVCSLPEKFLFETATGQLLSAILLYDLMVHTHDCKLDLPYQALQSLASRSTPLYPFTNFFLHAYLSECLSKMGRHEQSEEECRVAEAALAKIPAHDRPPLEHFLAATREAVPSP